MLTEVKQLKFSGQLPSPKGVALAILELSRRDNVTLGEIARVVQTDPALAGRLLKLANTGSRIARPVASVQEAVARQGVATVRQLALGFSLLDQYRSGACESFDYEAYWSHSLLMGLAMQALGERVRVAATDELFICGLLAQVGRLALATAYPNEYSQVLAAWHAGASQSLPALERSHLETDHKEMGIVLLTDWGMPRFFTGPVAQYEDPDADPLPHDSRSHSLALMLRLAHRLADLGLADADERPGIAMDWMAIAAELDLTQDASGRLIDEVIANWQDWGDLFKIRTTALPTIEEIGRASAKAIPSNVPLRIVLADANAGRRRRIAATLTEQEGHVVYPADNGSAALALAMEILPHTIIAHFDLPNLDGAELCKTLRATDEGRHMHVLLMADAHGEGLQTDAYEAGADGFVPGDISAAGLRAKLYAAQRMVNLQDSWAKDRAQLRQVAAELAVANRRLANAALTDMLTGLPNRRSAMDQLEQAWSAASRACTPISAMVIDIDDFKFINDTYGHAAGDMVLREVARTLRAAARREDSVCRIGGEEFLVICPNTNLKAAMRSAERLRAALEGSPVAIGDEKKTVTASFGVAAREPSIASMDALISAADQSLYHAKKAGRNRAFTKQRMVTPPA